MSEVAGAYSRTAVVIPALNEADNLRTLLPALSAYGFGRIIVADNGSTDSTAAVARSLGATVADAPQRGYGAACYAALRLLSADIESVLFLDADRSDDPGMIPALLDPLVADSADFVIGSRVRRLRERGAMTLPQIFGDRLATLLIRIGWGYRYYDLGPFRGDSSQQPGSNRHAGSCVRLDD